MTWGPVVRDVRWRMHWGRPSGRPGVGDVGCRWHWEEQQGQQQELEDEEGGLSGRENLTNPLEGGRELQRE